jgi:hypothetical protein
LYQDGSFDAWDGQERDESGLGSQGTREFRQPVAAGRHFPRFWKRTKVITPRDFITRIAPHLFP